MEVEVDEKLLAEIADRTGGAFFAPPIPEALAGVFAEIDRLEKTPLQGQALRPLPGGLQPFAWSALALLRLPRSPPTLRVTVEP